MNREYIKTACENIQYIDLLSLVRCKIKLTKGGVVVYG